MNIEYVSAFTKFNAEFCSHFPNGYLKCDNYHMCRSCEVADRLRMDKLCSGEDFPLFYWRDALPQTPTGGGETWYGKPVILSPEAMKRLKLQPHLINQIMIAYDGPGVFKKNTHGAIDGYLLYDPQKRFTVTRNECYGIPNENAAMRYDDLFFLGLCKLLKIPRKQEKRG